MASSKASSGSIMKIITIINLIIISFLSFCKTTSSTMLSSNHTAVFNFGDSNSDTGGLVAGLGFPEPYPYGQTYFHNPSDSGRFSDGRLIIDFLMESMDLPFLRPYLESVNAPNFHRGCNFATGGSTILPPQGRTLDISPFSFDVQVAQFIRFKARVLRLLSEDNNLQLSLPSEEYFAQGLYMIDIGQNDLDGAFDFNDDEQVIALIPSMISRLEIGIKKLYDQGARRYWIHNTGPLGCLPEVIAKYGKDPLKRNELGSVASHNRVANFFNLQLSILCQQIQKDLSGVELVYVDMFSIKLNLISNYSKLGFAQSTSACCGYGGLPLNYDDRIICGRTIVLNGISVTAKACENPFEYVNWDGTHYTESANFYVTSQILTGKYSHSLFSEEFSLPQYPMYY